MPIDPTPAASDGPRPSTPISWSTTNTTVTAAPGWHKAHITWDAKPAKLEDPTMKVNAPDQLLAALSQTWQLNSTLVLSLHGIVERLSSLASNHPQAIMPAGVIAVARSNRDMVIEATKLAQQIDELIGHELHPVTVEGIDEHATHDCSTHAAVSQGPRLIIAPQDVQPFDVFEDGKCAIDSPGGTDGHDWIVRINDGWKLLPRDKPVIVVRNADHDAGLIDQTQVNQGGSIDATALMEHIMGNASHAPHIDGFTIKDEATASDEAELADDLLQLGQVRIRADKLRKGYDIFLFDGWVHVLTTVPMGEKIVVVDTNGGQHVLDYAEMVDAEMNEPIDGDDSVTEL